MSPFIRCAAMAALMLSTASLTMVTALSPVDAAQRAAPKAKAAAGPTTRPAIGQPLNDAIKALNMMDFATALAKTQIADKVAMKTPYEEYLVAKILGSIAINQPMRDFASATVAYTRMMDSGGAPDTDKEQMYDLAMKLNFQAKNTEKVIQAANALKMIRPLDDTESEVIIQTYYQMNDYQNTIVAAKEAVQTAQAAGQRPKPSILGMLLNAEAKAMDPGYRATLDQLAMVSNQPEVWSQVMDFALATKNISDHQLLNLFRLAVRVGTMRDTDYPAMATISLSSGLSIEGKSVLEKAVMEKKIMRNGSVAALITQANGLIEPERKSLPEIAAEAPKARNGEVYVKLGESYWVNGQIPQAIDAMQKGIEKGGVKDMSDAQTTLGIMLMDAGRQMEAIAAFQKAETAGGTGAPVAHSWALYAQRSVT